jgi:hypothetical protein
MNVDNREPHVGGTAPERVEEDLRGSLERVKEEEHFAADMEFALARAERKLEAAIDAMLASPAQAVRWNRRKGAHGVEQSAATWLKL